MRRRELLGLVMIVAVATVVVASGTDEADSQMEDVTEISMMHAGTDPAYLEYMESAIERYRERTGVSVDFFAAPFGSEIDTKISAAFASGLAPDVIDHGILSIADRADKGQYAALDSFIESWDQRQDLLPEVFDIASYRDNVYGLAYFPAPILFVYRKDYFREAGLDPDDPPGTWEELADAAVRLTRRDGDTFVRMGFALESYNFPVMNAFAAQNGAVPHDEDGNPTFNTDEWVETFEFLYDLIVEKEVAPVVNSFSGVHPFVNGTAAMSALHPSQIAAMVNRDPSIENDIGFFFPANEREAVWAGSKILFIPEQAPHPDAAGILFSF